MGQGAGAWVGGQEFCEGPPPKEVGWGRGGGGFTKINYGSGEPWPDEVGLIPDEIGPPHIRLATWIPTPVPPYPNFLLTFCGGELPGEQKPDSTHELGKIK